MSNNSEGGRCQLAAGKLPSAADEEELIAGAAKEKRAIVVMVQKFDLSETYQQHTSNWLQTLGFLTYHCTRPTTENPVGSDVSIALDASVFTDEDVLGVYDIAPGKVMAIEVESGEGSITLVNTHGPGLGDDQWSKTTAFWSEMLMFVTAKSKAGTHPLPVGGEFNIQTDRPEHATTHQFMDAWVVAGFVRPGAEDE